MPMLKLAFLWNGALSYLTLPFPYPTEISGYRSSTRLEPVVIVGGGCCWWWMVVVVDGGPLSSGKCSPQTLLAFHLYLIG